ncbi:hypothetical protein G5714_020762 [Onychostoma macrolepis]|uniref:Uncharacterized protein n=1 Tax=Onychostoma macrolepis TaxID=369639 RepID=A0A7J6BYI0_9TELE|nr:hypothetical protein G5714_020762 [Onychostoma macrolepis]
MIGNKTSIRDGVFKNEVGVLRVLIIRTITVIYHCMLRKRDKHFNTATSPNEPARTSLMSGDVAVALFTDDTNFITNL